MAVPLDNPSYFTFAGGLTSPTSNKNKFRLFKKKMVSSSTEINFVKNNTVNNRRPLKSLLRSVSSNSADSNQELLVLGEPRASDIAPPSPELSSHKKKFNKRSADLNDDLVYCPLSTSEELSGDNVHSEEEEEVFLAEDSVKYYNVSKETGRRHSIGTYLTHERERALSIASSSRSCKEEAIVHATVEGEIIRASSVGTSSKKCSRTSSKRDAEHSIRGVSMDDILIVSSCDSEAASLWVNYFSTCFEQYSKQKGRPTPKILQLGLEEISKSEFTQAFQEKIAGVKLQLVIVCPRFLELVEENPIACSNFGKCLRPDRTLAMLLGVTDDSLNDIHHAALTSYRHWQRHIVGQDQDENFTRDFLTAAINILTKVARQQQQQAIEERTTFSVIPKKVKQSQNRLIILLAEPLTKEDVIKVSVDKNGEMIEIKSIKRRNPYTLKFIMPECCLEISLIVNILVEKNGDLLGARPVKCESRLRELDQILRTSNSPLEFICQTLGFSPSNKDQLDHWMVHNFQKNIPPHFNLLSSTCHIGDHSQSRHIHSHEEYPTLLHFAARFGLEKLAWQLLECPGGDTAIDIRNVCDLTPAEMAEMAGHSKLANTLCGYMQMNEFTNMYRKLKEMAEAKEEPKPETPLAPEVDQDEYLLPRGVEQSYCIPPPAKPVTTLTPSSSSTLSAAPITGYLEMQPSGKTSSNKGTLTKNKNKNQSNTTANPQITRLDSTDSSDTNTSVPYFPTNFAHKYEDKVQGELLEILNDFKNNVFTLSEVEQLVETWRNRNDVQNSFKEKQEQLNLMRQECERIQQMLKEKMKRPNPIERIKKLFFGSKHKECENIHIEKNDTSLLNSEEKLHNYMMANNLRPISSLSLQSTASTSSSGRMSTLSGCSAASFGDSGTHSDHEERKHLVRQTSEHDYFEINDPKKSHYLVPPAPKPIHKYNQLKQHNSSPQQFSTINERPPHPVPRIEAHILPENDQHYIQFPPSGLPVNDFKMQSNLHISASSLPSDDQSEYLTMENQSTEYLNIEPSEYIGGKEQLQEYMNIPHDDQKDENEENEYAETEELLPEYMNVGISPVLPPRRS